MNIDFKQRIVIAIIGGLFVLAGAYISQQKQASSNVSHIVTHNSPAIAISNGGYANAVSNSNVSIIDQRVFSNNGGITISGNNGDVNINQNSSNDSNVNIPVNEQRYNQ